MPAHDEELDLTSFHARAIAWTAIVTCERCGCRHEMPASTYMAGWRTGMRCGLCEPSYPWMRVRFVHEHGADSYTCTPRRTP